MAGKLFVISGPSGAGKGSIIEKLLERDPTLYFSISATTRPKRDYEIICLCHEVHYTIYPRGVGRIPSVLPCGERLTLTSLP